VWCWHSPFGRSVVGAGEPPVLPEEWWTGKIDRPLRCSWQKYPATLGFDFRYWTGLTSPSISNNSFP
jgi:hypothetical protein